MLALPLANVLLSEFGTLGAESISKPYFILSKQSRESITEPYIVSCSILNREVEEEKRRGGSADAWVEEPDAA